MYKQLVHSKYPINGKEMRFNKVYSLTTNFFVQFIPLLVMIIMDIFQFNIIAQVLIIPLIYLICGGRWTLNYHNLLHQLSGVNVILDIFLGVGFGHLLTFSPAKKGHDSHHNFNYGQHSRKLSLESIEELNEKDINYRTTQILGKDADFWCKSSPNCWTLFLRSAQFEFNYIQFYVKKKQSAKWSYFPIFLSRLVLLLVPYLILNPILYTIHLMLCRMVMAVVFMVFTTLAHQEGWFDTLVDMFYPAQQLLDVNTLLEVLIGYHVHHVNEHDNHHTFPTRDVSILAKLFEDFNLLSALSETCKCWYNRLANFLQLCFDVPIENNTSAKSLHN